VVSDAGGRYRHILRRRPTSACGHDHEWRSGAPPRRPRSKDRDVAFEVYAACLATRFATDVRLDGPDLLFRFGGQTIGVACKAIYGNDVSKPLRKGRDQIEAAKCDAGIVLVQLTNRIPRNELFRCINQATQEYTVWTRAADALRRFDELAITAADPLRDELRRQWAGPRRRSVSSRLLRGLLLQRHRDHAAASVPGDCLPPVPCLPSLTRSRWRSVRRSTSRVCSRHRRGKPLKPRASSSPQQAQQRPPGAV